MPSPGAENLVFMYGKVRGEGIESVEWYSGAGQQISHLSFPIPFS